MSWLSMRVVSACLVLALLSSCGCLTSAQYNNSNPSVLYHDANTAAIPRMFPACTFNIHALQTLTSIPAMWSIGGGYSYTAYVTYDFSVTGNFDTGFDGYEDGFQTIVPLSFNWNYGTNFTGLNPLARIAAAAAVLVNGNVLLAGGKIAGPTSSFSVRASDVIYSNNTGLAWYLATAAAAWPPRSDFTMISVPGTNVALVIAGTTPDGSASINDVWMSSDGIGAVWSLQTLNAPWTPFTQGAATALYDGVASGGSRTYATVLVYSPYDDQVWSSTNYGVGWAAISPVLSSIGVGTGNLDGRMLADAQNNVYFVGGDTDLTQVLFSSNQGVTWSLLNTLDYSRNISNTVKLSNNPAGAGAFPSGAFTYGCLAFHYTPSTTAPSGYHRTLSLYGGFIYVDALVNSGFQCVFDSGTVEVNTVQAEIIYPGESYIAAQPAQAVGIPGVVFHDPAQQLPLRLYSDCAYDVHQAVSKTANFSMWQLGGFNPYYSYLNTIDYSASGTWSTGLQEITPTYSGAPNGVAPSGRVAGGAALLYNRNFLYFGGKDTNASVYTNDVYYSTNYGQTFTYSGIAQWNERSDFVVAVMPYTNYVVLAGGMYSSTGAANGNAQNDVWMSSDGYGSTWTQMTAAANTNNGNYPGILPFTDAAFVALYDNSAISSSNTQQYSTLLLYTAAFETIYSSTNGGAAWIGVGGSPWSYRTRGMFVADADNYVYFTGGAATGDVWFSANKGATWDNINTAGTNSNNLLNGFNPSSVYQNLANYVGIVAASGYTGTCMALRYVANSSPGVPNGYHKQLILYGGSFAINAATQPSPSCVTQTSGSNVLYGEIMFPAEYSASWTDTSGLPTLATSTTTPQIAFNSPNVLFTYRQYPTCAADVHSLPSFPSNPIQFALGGWDANGNVLGTYDRFNGSNTANYAYISTFQGAVLGRAASGAAYLSNGNLLWFGGKTNGISATVTVANDVWYSTQPNFAISSTTAPPQWLPATGTAPWIARSDMSVAVYPKTNTVLLAGGSDVNGNLYNDVWLSSDGIGAVWTQQIGVAPFPQFSQGAMVALYDGTATGGSQTYATVLLFSSSYPSYNQYVYASTSQGTSWSVVGDAPWTTRFSEKFVADAQNNVYMIGGSGLSDTWYSSNKGVSWQQMKSTTSAGYSQAVLLASATYACNFINYSPSSSAPNGYHRQLTTYSGFISVYSPNVAYGGSATYGNLSIPQCLCDTSTGVRTVLADLIFPGETVNSASTTSISSSSTSSSISSSSTGTPSTTPVSSSTGTVAGGGSSSSSNSFSQGQTAGIAVGVGIGCMLLCCLLFVLYTFATGGNRKRVDQPARPAKFEDEPSAASTASGVEMQPAQV